MRKTMVRIFAVVLVLAMAIGFLAMIPASAATEPVQIMAHNVYFDEYLQIMYAVYIPNGVTIDKIELTDGKNTFEAVKFDQQPVIDGKTCQAYVAANGVSLQAIDTVVTAKVYVDGQVVAEDQYSILQYIRKRLYVEEVTGDWKDLCTNLLATAESLQTVLPGETVTVNNYGYVYVENGTVNGNSDAIFVNGTVLTKDMLAVPYGTATEWTYQIVGGDTGVLGEEGLAIGTNNIILTATKIDESTDPTEPVDPENANRYYIATKRSSGNYYYMTSDLGTASTKRYAAVDSGLTELPTAITAPEKGYVFVLEENGDGTYAIYAEGVEGNNYLGWTSGNSGALVAEADAKSLTMDINENGTYSFHFAGDAERYLALNGNSGNDYFAWYKTGQKQELTLIPVVSEGGEVPTEPTEPEVTEPEVTEPEVTEPEVTEPEETNTEEATISFADKANRVSQDASQQIWAQNAITVTNNKAASTTAVADYANPVRFYKGSELIIASKDMTKIVVVCNGASYATALAGSTFEDGVTATADGSNVTIDFSGKKDSVTIQLTVGQVQVKSITVTRVACPHSNTANVAAKPATCTQTGIEEGSVYCNDCEIYIAGGIIPVAAHDYKSEVTTKATCTDDGEKTFTCSSCGDSYTETIKATGHNYVNDVCENCGEKDPNAGATFEEKTITFNMGNDGGATHYDGSEKSSYSQTVDGMTLSLTGGSKMYTGARDAKGNGGIKLGTGSAAGKFTFTVPENVTSVTIYIAKYKANTSKVTINGTTYTLTKNSNDGAYDAITIDTTTTKTISLTTVSGGYRAMVNTIEFVAKIEK